MSLTLSEATTAAYTPPEAGTFPARCVSLIDLGSQQTTYEGETKTTPLPPVCDVRRWVAPGS